ncbi:MAG TPA: transglutaminase domain-containing protein, partial [Blastocatellia bacterium]
RLQFQREIPVQFVKYYLKPMQLEIAYSSVGMLYQTFNGAASAPVKEKDGFYTTSMTNVPALHEEPRMPPEDQVRIWMLLYYSKDKAQPPDVYWPKLGKDLYEKVKSGMKVNDDIKKTAAAAIGDATTPEQKLQRLYEFCHTKIKNINSVTSGMTEAEREKAKKNESAADTLKRGMGNGDDINQLFAALATAAGFEARPALLSDRSDVFFDKSFTHYYFLRGADVAVKVGSDWRFFDPGSPYLPFGLIRWQEEAIPALICDSKEAGFVQTPLASPDKSVQKRDGKFKLSEDGTLEGDVRIEYTGHFAIDRKRQNEDDSPSQREETLRDTIKQRISTAELSDIKVENVTDPDKPFVYAFHVRVPGYAQRTGKRLFLQPAFFEKGIAAMFPSSTRKHQVYFHYLWKEEDSVTIALPKGFALDNADMPGPLKAGDVAEYKVLAGVTKDGQELQYKRTFSFGGLIFPVSNYAALKGLFDRIQESDNHTISLKQAVAAQ